MSRTIAIVGAGFSGSTLATQLLRQPCETPLRVILVDAAQFGRGLAYARHRHPYLLNVRAAGMSADAADPLEFLQFARHRAPETGADDFVPREVYGDYLQARLADAETHRPETLDFQRIYGQVIAIDRLRRGGGHRLHLADGRHLDADEVVLALGNPPPRPLPVHAALVGTARCMDDPWKAPPAFREGERVLLVGTGLTMVDVVLAGLRSAEPAQIEAVSRRGLLPRVQAAPPPTPRRLDSGALLQAAGRSARALSRQVRALAQEVQLQGGDWREAITHVRELTPALWQQLSVPERQRFLRHLRPYWDAHRHRLPPSVHSQVEELQRSGQLRVRAARILAAEPAGKGIRVALRQRSTGQVTVQIFDRIINCTGPDLDIAHTRDRLLRSLASQGIVSRDPLGLGLRTDASGAVISATGTAATGLYYLGPMLRPACWESSAVAELRQHASALARHLSRRHQEQGLPGRRAAAAGAFRAHARSAPALF
jgi:uncharacterized NAD(P)/FAD-binding protein YdhS